MNDAKKLMLQAARALIIAIETDACVAASLVYLTDEGTYIHNGAERPHLLVPLIGATEIAQQEMIVSHAMAMQAEPAGTDTSLRVIEGREVGRG